MVKRQRKEDQIIKAKKYSGAEIKGRQQRCGQVLTEPASDGKRRGEPGTKVESFDSSFWKDPMFLEDAYDYDLDQQQFLESEEVMANKVKVICVDSGSSSAPSPQSHEDATKTLPSSTTKIKNLKERLKKQEQMLLQLRERKYVCTLPGQNKDVATECEKQGPQQTKANQVKFRDKSTNRKVLHRTQQMTQRCSDTSSEKSGHKAERKPRAKRVPRRKLLGDHLVKRKVDLWMAKGEDITQAEFLGVLGLIEVNDLTAFSTHRL